MLLLKYASIEEMWNKEMKFKRFAYTVVKQQTNMFWVFKQKIIFPNDIFYATQSLCFSLRW